VNGTSFHPKETECLVNLDHRHRYGTCDPSPIGPWSSGSPENLSASVGVLLDCGNLQRHFVTACDIVKRMADAIPDGQITDVVAWLFLESSFPLRCANGPLGETTIYGAAGTEPV
jgi:hypothetical protein